MTEHVHEWEFSEELGGYQCACWGVMSVREGAKRINAAERLSAEDARCGAQDTEHVHYDRYTGLWHNHDGQRVHEAQLAYADILEGK